MSLEQILFDEYFAGKNELTNMNRNRSCFYSAIRDIKIDSQLIHIAGTNGKGSTSYFIAQMLENENKPAILFTSPHIHKSSERILYRLRQTDDITFNDLFNKALDKVVKYNLSYFETILLMCLIYASELRPEYLILETGLGGSLDATNFINKIKTVVITTISQDHTEVLGKNIYNILYDKLSVAEKSENIFIGKNENFIVNEIKKKLIGKNLFFINNKCAQKLNSIYPTPFNYNYINAKNTVEFVLNKKLPDTKLKLPMCRLEKFGRVIIDGAHNAGALLELFNNLDKIPEIVIISTTIERDIKKFCNLIKKKQPNIIITSIADNSRSIQAQDYSFTGFTILPNPKDALEHALKTYKGEILVCGSLYLCAYMRELLIKNEI